MSPILAAILATSVAAATEETKTSLNEAFWVPNAGDLVYGFDLAGDSLQSIVVERVFDPEDRCMRNAFAIGLMFKTRKAAEQHLNWMNVDYALKNYPHRILSNDGHDGYGFRLVGGTLVVIATDTAHEEAVNGYVFPTIENIVEIMDHLSAEAIANWAKYYTK